MQVFLTAVALIALAEIGDKTQLLAIALATRLRRPLPIVAGIAVATLANHLLAGSVGVWLVAHVSPTVATWALGISFIGFGLWTLRADTLDKPPTLERGGAFVITVVAFFLVEMGDKTQLATLALAARYPGSLGQVVAGTTVGMLLADGPAVWIGDAMANRIPMARLRLLAAALFVAMGVYTLVHGAG